MGSVGGQKVFSSKKWMLAQEKHLENGPLLRSYISGWDGTLNILGYSHTESFTQLWPSWIKQTRLRNKHIEHVKKYMNGRFNEVINPAGRTLYCSIYMFVNWLRATPVFKWSSLANGDTPLIKPAHTRGSCQKCKQRWRLVERVVGFFKISFKVYFWCDSWFFAFKFLIILWHWKHFVWMISAQTLFQRNSLQWKGSRLSPWVICCNYLFNQ